MKNNNSNIIQLFLLNNNVQYLIRLFMGAIFIYASFSKIHDPALFSNMLHNYGVTPLAIENIIALTLPWIELFIGLGLIFEIKYEACLDISIFLIVLFILLILQAYLRDRSIYCGCFMGSDETMSLEKAIEMRADMLKRIFEDIIFLILLFTLKYKVYDK